MVTTTGVLDGGAQKTPLAQSLHRLGAAKAGDAVQLTGKSLPCTVKTVINPWVVEVSFAVNSAPWTLQPVRMPVLAPPYIAYPIQVGDAGRAVASDYREGSLTGLGSGTPNLTDKPANLSCLGFVWLGNTSWATPDPNAVVIAGPNKTANLVIGDTQLAFFGGAKVSKQTVTGALSSVTDANAKAVLTSIITALTNYGLITNGTT